MIERITNANCQQCRGIGLITVLGDYGCGFRMQLRECECVHYRNTATTGCAAVNRDGYECELETGHADTLHRALIGETDEQGPVPEVQWREKAEYPVVPR
jgi:hypothetical protein